VMGLGLAAGDKLRDEFQLPPNVIAVPFAPQRALISRASLVITHAGLNSTLETLTAGVPMITIPISHDQPGVAARVRRLGAGCSLPAAELSSEKLRTLLQHVLATPRYALAAKDCAARLQQINGVAIAADVVEEAFQSPTRKVEARGRR
jgi:zeaxanthin glucosyltransferase